MKKPDNPISKLPDGLIAQLPNNLPIVFFGSSKFVIPILEVLQKNFTLSLALTTEKNPTDPVPSYCIKNKIPYLSVQQFNNLPRRKAGLTIQQLQKTNATVGILADFGLIIPKEILNAFPKGIINIHPSLLPKYRGPSPVQSAILNREKVTGVTIIKLDEEIDHGPILGQQKEEILDTDTSESLYKRLFAEGANLLIKILDNYIEGSLKLTAQNHKKATFTLHLTRQDGYIDLSSLKIENSLPLEVVTKWGKLKIDRMIRAYFPWPGVWTKAEINGKEKIIKLLPNYLKSQYPNDLFLIQVEGKKPISYKDFVNGYPKAKEIIKILEN